MAKKSTTKRTGKKREPIRKRSRKAKGNPSKKRGSAPKRQPSSGISDARLEIALRFIRESGDLNLGARSIRVRPERLKRIALKRKLIRKSGGKWIVAGRLPRRMLLYSNGSELIVTTRSLKSASLIGSYMTAVRNFLRTNDPSGLAEFGDAGIKDTAGKIHPFEINPNILYQLGSAGGETFEDIYQIVI